MHLDTIMLGSNVVAHLWFHMWICTNCRQNVEGLLYIQVPCHYLYIPPNLHESHSSYRNPQATKRKNAIQDWHLLLVILSLLVMNAGVMCLHILLEGVVANFNAAQTPDKEIKSTIRGVRHLNFKI